MPYLPGKVKSVCTIVSSPVRASIDSLDPEKYDLNGEFLSAPYTIPISTIPSWEEEVVE